MSGHTLESPLDAFVRAVATEARTHGADASVPAPTPAERMWRLGILAIEAANAQAAGNVDKAMHDLVQAGSLIAGWHCELTRQPAPGASS